MTIFGRSVLRLFPANQLPKRNTHTHLLGAFSSPEIQKKLAGLNKLRRRILQECADSPRPSTTAPPRIGQIPKAIAKVLAKAPEPMHTTAIHQAVEQDLGLSVNYRTIKACLSNETQKKRPRFERVARGEYKLVS